MNEPRLVNALNENVNASDIASRRQDRGKRRRQIRFQPHGR